MFILGLLIFFDTFIADHESFDALHKKTDSTCRTGESRYPVFTSYFAPTSPLAFEALAK